MIACFGVCYVGRVCWGAVLVGGRTNKEFLGWPKRVDDAKISTNLDALCKMNLDVATIKTLVVNFTDNELRDMDNIFCLLQKTSCRSLPFDSGIGARMYIPSRQLGDQQNRSGLIAAIQGTKNQ